MDKPIAWYDPSNGAVSTDKDCPLFTPLGQVWGLYLKEEAKDEPVAWVCMKSEMHDIDFDQPEIDAIPVGTMLYTTPPQRTWVGLTDEEIRLQWSEFWEAECHPWAIEFARAIEAKLKEKNT
jgi:hypothetical protein